MKRKITIISLSIAISLVISCLLALLIEMITPPTYFAQFEDLSDVEYFLHSTFTLGQSTLTDVREFTDNNVYDLRCNDLQNVPEQVHGQYFGCFADSDKTWRVYGISFLFSNDILIDIGVSWVYAGL